METNERRDNSIPEGQLLSVPRVLVISNNCFSQTDSNGRTLQNFFIGWPGECLAQFYIQNSLPDFSVCQNYFRVTDSQALNAFLGKNMDGGIIRNNVGDGVATSVSGGKKHQRTALTMMLRELVWNSKRWRNKAFYEWLDRFDPQVVLLQAGDCGFMMQLSRDVAERFNVPLVIYNSEAYYFKKFDYFRAAGIAHWCYPIFRLNFCRQFRKTISRAVRSIYICKALQDDYDREFSLPSETIYTATTVDGEVRKNTNSDIRVSYLGNLGVGRHEILVEIAEILNELSLELHLDIYGKIPNKEVQEAFDACTGICYRGFVSYEQVISVMRNSDILIHAENFSGFYRKDLKYAFSTKIADSLASRTCFIVYAPEEMACTRYLAENKAAWVVSDWKRLREVLRLLIEEPNERSRYLANAESLVRKNHDAKRNGQRFQKILCDVWEKHQ